MNPYIRLPKIEVVYGRQEIILDRCRGKRVLHLGCVDEGYLGERFQRGELMHQRLATVSKELWGIDIHEKGIEYLRGKGFENLFVGDICAIDKIEAIQNKCFDTIVASEVMEHLQNPGLFLSSVRSLMVAGKTDLIVTVPNAFRMDTLLWLFHRIEYVHPGHHCWFSYGTITNLLRENRFTIEEAYVYSFNPISNVKVKIRGLHARKVKDEKKSIKKALSSSLRLLRKAVTDIRSLPKSLITLVLLKINPFWGDGVIIVARVHSDVS